MRKEKGKTAVRQDKARGQRKEGKAPRGQKKKINQTCCSVADETPPVAIVVIAVVCDGLLGESPSYEKRRLLEKDEE